TRLGFRRLPEILLGVERHDQHAGAGCVAGQVLGRAEAAGAMERAGDVEDERARMPAEVLGNGERPRGVAEVLRGEEVVEARHRGHHAAMRALAMRALAMRALAMRALAMRALAMRALGRRAGCG